MVGGGDGRSVEEWRGGAQGAGEEREFKVFIDSDRPDELARRLGPSGTLGTSAESQRTATDSAVANRLLSALVLHYLLHPPVNYGASARPAALAQFRGITRLPSVLY